ncbi:hypothetical protein BKA67DRAFT_580878 [Truncatella angustata]|uniref:Uncharacterized protein n=1 Tax=Truncatella angustata TaxID=152316 RepID=A0A9P8UD01_9PEZI|nr:uncharacterized protein BKA67DRAFT_580878 [Truncatella angustata]KAH6646910.1 hypothetical protein BKA67DRAFT_580878 [Truncatella angustata]
MAAAGIVDPTKAGKYPVVLSDALLGKRSSEVYTGVRCKRRQVLSFLRAVLLRTTTAG